MINRAKLQTLWKLGPVNVLAVARYRALLRLGVFKRTLPLKEPLSGPFLSDRTDSDSTVDVPFFSHHSFRIDFPPDWFVNRWNSARVDPAHAHWSGLSDFDPSLGDIKTVWELSRMDWAPRFCWSARRGNSELVSIVESWLRDWCEKNPGNAGVNWKCGQETALRALNLLVSAKVLGDRFDSPYSGFVDLLEQHGERINKTLSYAIAQDNNHGTSEAAGLFLIGSYLARHLDRAKKNKALRWQAAGRKWLENRARRLIMRDGSFSQHSIVYHRMMLDTLALTELMRREFAEPPFSQMLYERAGAATNWLAAMVDPVSGDAPNLGANDGTHLFRMDDTSYRDFRQSANLASSVFLNATIFPISELHPLMQLFDAETGSASDDNTAGCQLFPEGGYAVMRNKQSMALLRLPIFKFRPSHADALHVDIWEGGANLVVDSGTFSYNGEIKGNDSQRWFSGTARHNTVEFDSKDQMPAISRFLFSDWLEPSSLDFDPAKCRICCGYVTKGRGSHTRSLSLNEAGWCVTDTIDGSFKTAVIRWHLAPGDWSIEDSSLVSSLATITVDASQPCKLTLGESLVSRHYLEYEKVSVLEVTVTEPAIVTTAISPRRT